MERNQCAPNLAEHGEKPMWTINTFGPENSEPNKNQFRQTNNIRRGQHGECTVENNLFVTVSKIRNSGILTHGLEFWPEESQTMSLVFQDHC